MLLVGCFVAAVVVAGEQEGIAVVLEFGTPFVGTDPVEPCEGPYKGRTLTPEELETVLRNHEEWLEELLEEWRKNTGRKLNDTQRANLCQANLQRAHLQGARLERANLQGADLILADLQKANLSWANLQGARLQEAHLQEADLFGAHLQGTNLAMAHLQGAVLLWAHLQKADLILAHLQGARLDRADLQGADLAGADLQGAVLILADLQEADLAGADLQGAVLILADLQEADLAGANLQGAVYEPNPGKLPKFWTLTDPHKNNLGTLRFHRSPAALIELREAFKKGGMRTQERQLTYAIEHTRRLQAWDPSWFDPKGKDTRPWLEKLAGKSESLFSYVLFELPSGYGMVPSRTLATLGLLILVFSLVYMVALLMARGRAGIWVTWPTDRVYQEEGAREATRITTTFFFPRLQTWAAERWWGALLRGMSVPLIGLYFSLLSAFSLGWRELNVGTWIARMQPREYVLRATGWVRFVAGLQSLLSVYLLALWVLTYFGRPFE